MRFFFLFLVSCFSLQALANPALKDKKVLQVKVDGFGLVTVGRDTVGADHLARYIQERLFKSYIGTGEMYDRIEFATGDEYVPETVAQVVMAEIKNGQQKALQILCLQKFNKTFDMLDHRKQDKLKKTFPVLFQETYHPNT